MSGTLFQQELEELKALREVATEYRWADDDPAYSSENVHRQRVGTFGVDVV